MDFFEYLLIILGAVFVGVLFYYVFKMKGPWGTFWSFVIILILAGIAAEQWITPVGPIAYGIAWVPTVFVILLFALLMAAISPSHKMKIPSDNKSERKEKESTALGLSAAFWVFLIFLLFIIVWGMMR